MLGNMAAWLGQVPLVDGHVHRPQGLSGRRPRLAGSAQALTDSTFSQALAASKAVVDFWSPSCPYCVAYKPVFEDVASQALGDILMATVNVVDNPTAPSGYQVQGIPATIFLVNGKEVHREEGSLSKDDLLRAIAQAFGGPAPAPGGPVAPTSSSKSFTDIAMGIGALGAVGALIYFVAR